jgi:branched-chain amino acid transport system permease protein
MKNTNQLWKLSAIIILGTVVFILPRTFTSGYMVNAMIDSVRWIIFALSFDLVAGHVGAVSLGHPAFFGLGAYVTAILGPKLGLGFISNGLLSATTMALFAFIAGLAFFRIRGVTFAIGTLGAVIIAQLLANNAFDLTGGPLCVKGVPRPSFTIPFSETVLKITQPIQYFYLLLPLLVITIIVYRAMTKGRIGQAFAAVREDEVRAQSIGINPLRYKLLAFSVGAALIGALGSFQAQYITIVCPSEIALSLTTTLLIIVFVGGIGTMRGVILGAIIFSSLPRILESFGSQANSSAYQQMAYGVILMIVMIFVPNGLDGLLSSISGKFQNWKASKSDNSK